MGRDAGPSRDGGCAAVVRVVGAGAYCTIAEAVAHATAGDVVEVPAGTFTEAVRVETGLTLRGVPEATTLESPDTTTALRLYGTNVVVESMVVRGAFSLLVDGDATIRSSTISSSSRVAVTVAPDAVGVFERTRIEGAGPPNDVVTIFQRANVTLSESRVEASLGFGVSSTGASLRVSGSTIAGSGQGGIYAELGSQVTVVRGSRITGNMVRGIQIRESSLVMRDSESSMSANGDGLWLVDPVSAVIERSVFAANGGWGINCTVNADADQCTDNTFTSNALGDTNCARCAP
ncbi:right-handed parallel beta-helix repeat-containing protein [Myxococcota bacterium]|nr:right-handed parallel beta-helix repeat-containing protein [Myxococcota bacterium]